MLHTTLDSLYGPPSTTTQRLSADEVAKTVAESHNRVRLVFKYQKVHARMHYVYMVVSFAMHRIVTNYKESIAEQLQEALKWMLKNHREMPNSRWVPKLEARYIINKYVYILRGHAH